MKIYFNFKQIYFLNKKGLLAKKVYNFSFYFSFVKATYEYIHLHVKCNQRMYLNVQAYFKFQL